MTEAAENLFQGIGAPPEGQDPEAQLSYLKRVVEAFQATGNPRLKPLRQKLDQALLAVAQGAERNLDPEKLAQQFAREVDELRFQTFELLVTVVNQTRATLRVKLRQALPPEQRVDTEKLQKALGLFAQGLRKTLTAAKKADPQASDEGNRLLDEAGKLMEESGRELQGQG
jgi:hypothetical protein